MRIVVVDHHRYGSVVRVGSHQIAAELLRRGHEVVWIPHARSWLHRLRGPLPPPVVDHEDGVREITLRAVAPYVEIPALPFLGSTVWGERWLKGARRQLRAAGLTGCALLWLSDFTMLPLLDAIDAEQVVLRFFDHLEGYRRMPHSVLDLARRRQGRADLVVGSSKSVCRRLAEVGIETVHLPNGTELRPETPAPAVASEREDRVVYVGALGTWFDLAAVELWAAALPEVRFEIGGPNPRGLASDLPNLRFLGPVPYERVPELLLGARFGLIPFTVDPFTRGIHPLKLYEYLAAGCPVLSSDLPEVDEGLYGVFKYHRPEEGAELLERHLHDDLDRARLHAFAAENTWSHRLDCVAALLGWSL